MRLHYMTRDDIARETSTCKCYRLVTRGEREFRACWSHGRNYRPATGHTTGSGTCRLLLSSAYRACC
jgi:hypothetical protein